MAFYVREGVPFSLLEKTSELYPDVAFTRDLPGDVVKYGEADFIRGGYHLPERRDNLLVGGGFQIHWIFDRATLIRQFACPKRARDIIFEKYGEALSATQTVGVSVRRGDYMKIPHLHPFVGESYLKRAIHAFDESSTFIVCSDDIPWCRNFFSAPRFPRRRFVFVEGEDILTQLFIHTFCHHNIISNSSFSWWGAYLNVHERRRVVFPGTWYGITYWRNQALLYLPEAEILPCRHSIAQSALALMLNYKKLAGDFLRAVHLRKPRKGVLPEFFN